MPNYHAQNIIQSARNQGVSDTNQKPCLPEWINPKLIKAGKEFVSRHFFLIFFTHFISLILLLGYVPVRAVLIKTKRSHSTDLALTRYLSTLRHVKLWYEGDLTSDDSEAVQDVVKVRRIHSGVAKRIQSNSNSKLCEQFANFPECLSETGSIKSKLLLKAVKQALPSENEKNNNFEDDRTSSVAISQLDMITTQYCFMGLVTTFPHKFGISLKSEEDVEGLKGFIHIWAVVGHLLGIEDKYNLCLGEKSMLRTFILQDILLKDLASASSETVVLWEALVNAMSTFVPCLSLHASILYILEHVMEIKHCANFLDSAAVYDKFCYNLTLFLLNVCFKSVLIRTVFNYLLRSAIYITSVRLGLLKIISRVV